MDNWQIIVLLGLLVVVYAYLIPKSGVQNLQSNLLKEVEETFEHFAAELEEENKELIKHIAEMKKDYDLNSSKLLGRIEGLESQIKDLARRVETNAVPEQQSSPQPSLSSIPSTADNENLGVSFSTDVHKAITETIVKIAASSQKTISPAASQVVELDENLTVLHDNSLSLLASHLNIKERYQDIFQYYTQGKSIEFIAKKLGMNKGEVQLIIELARQEEQFRV